MNLDISKVKFSKRDIKNKIKIPKKLNKSLAYLIGIHLGDGTMNLYRKYDYYISYSGHLKDEYVFYTKHLKELFKNLFNKNLRIYRDLRKNKSSVRLSTQSKAIFMFLNKIIGIPAGPKTNTSIPNSKYKKEFIKGLADSDFSLTFKKGKKGIHCYPVICFYSSNKKLVNETSELLRKIGFKTYTLFNLPHRRYEKIHTTNLLEVDGEKQLKLWMEKIGFNSRKHLTKYFIWKKFGFCPPFTTLKQRERILNKVYLKPL